MPFTIRGQVDIRPILRRLDGLKQGMRNAVLRPAVRGGCRIVLKAAKAKCPVYSGNQPFPPPGILKKALGIKVKTYKGRVLGLIGPRTGFKVTVAVNGKNRNYDPANVSHNVEFGHGGKSAAPEHPFMRPAWDESIGAVRAVMADIVGTQLAKLATGRASLWAGISDGGD